MIDESTVIFMFFAVHLFQALSLNAKLVLPMHFTRLWSQITGIDADDDSGSNLLPYEKHVPLLMKDVSAILLQLLYALPFNIDKGLQSNRNTDEHTLIVICI